VVFMTNAEKCREVRSTWHRRRGDRPAQRRGVRLRPGAVVHRDARHPVVVRRHRADDLAGQHDQLHQPGYPRPRDRTVRPQHPECGTDRRRRLPGRVVLGPPQQIWPLRLRGGWQRTRRRTGWREHRAGEGAHPRRLRDHGRTGRSAAHRPAGCGGADDGSTILLDSVLPSSSAARRWPAAWEALAARCSACSS